MKNIECPRCCSEEGIPRGGILVCGDCLASHHVVLMQKRRPDDWGKRYSIKKSGKIYSVVLDGVVICGSYRTKQQAIDERDRRIAVYQ